MLTRLLCTVAHESDLFPDASTALGYAAVLGARVVLWTLQ